MAAPLIFNSTEIALRRLNKRRFLFFSCAFVLTSLATWVMAEGTQGPNAPYNLATRLNTLVASQEAPTVLRTGRLASLTTASTVRSRLAI